MLRKIFPALILLIGGVLLLGSALSAADLSTIHRARPGKTVAAPEPTVVRGAAVHEFAIGESMIAEEHKAANAMQKRMCAAARSWVCSATEVPAELRK